MKRNSMKKETPDAPLAPVQDVAAVETKAFETIVIEIPYRHPVIDPLSHKDKTKRIDFGRLTSDEWRKLRAMRNGFMLRGDTFADGRPVESLTAMFRMFLAKLDI